MLPGLGIGEICTLSSHSTINATHHANLIRALCIHQEYEDQAEWRKLHADMRPKASSPNAWSDDPKSPNVSRRFERNVIHTPTSSTVGKSVRLKEQQQDPKSSLNHTKHTAKHTIQRLKCHPDSPHSSHGRNRH